MATYAVGDIQGCYDQLQALLEHIRFNPGQDQLWCCGDLVNRGGKSLETLRLLHSLGDRVVAVLGNHDLYLLQENWKYPDGVACPNGEFRKILAAEDRNELMSWLQHLPLAHCSRTQNVLMVHAGVVPQWTVPDTLDRAAEVESKLRSPKAGKFLSRLKKNAPRRWHDDISGWRRRRLISDILTGIRFCDSNGKILRSASGPPKSASKPYKAWFKHKSRMTRETTIVFGHWARLGLYMKKNVICLDTGCVWGGQLTAVRLEDRAIFQVPGKNRRR
jgi:bis(5'-nucleosyl)-tetraphosphatase (symmetrical)